MRRPPIACTLRKAGALLALAAICTLEGSAALAAPSPSALGGASAAASGPVAAASARMGARKPAAALTLGPGLLALPGPIVAMPPVGLSIEYPIMAEALGASACPPPALEQELEQLGSPPIQLAGASQDLTVPSGALRGPQSSWEAATLYTLPAAFWSQLHCLLEVTRDPLTVGLNLKTGSPAWAQQMVSEANAAAVDGVNFSLGNEPDLYSLPNYASLDKPLPGEELAVANLYIQLANALEQNVAGAPTVGPELARAERWRAQLPRVLAALHFQTVGVHLYPLTACATPRDVTVHGLLSRYAADAPEAYGWVVADASADGLPAIISEANSASCGGVLGVSNSPASAVWAVRFTLSALQTGFREVRFHLSGNAYDPFLVRGYTVLQRPLAAALIALNDWLPLGSVVHPVPMPAGSRLRARAIAQPHGGLVLVLDNRAGHAQRVLLKSAGALAVQVFEAARAGLVSSTLAPVAGRVSLSVPANAIAAVSLLSADGLRAARTGPAGEEFGRMKLARGGSLALAASDAASALHAISRGRRASSPAR